MSLTATTPPGVSGLAGQAGQADTGEIVAVNVPQRISDLNEVPEELQEQYRQIAEGVYEFMPVKGLRKALEAERKANAAAQQAVKGVRQRSDIALRALSALTGLADTDLADMSDEDLDLKLKTIATTKTAANVKPHAKSSFDDTDMVPQAVLQQALAEREADYQKSVRQLQAQLSALESNLAQTTEQFRQSVKRSAIDQALLAANATKTGSKVLPLMLDKELDVVLQPGKQSFEVVVKPNRSNSGDSFESLPYRVNKSGNPMTVAELLESSIKLDHPDLFSVPAPVPGTGGRTGSYVKGADGVVSISASKLSPAEYKKLKASGVDFRLDD